MNYDDVSASLFAGVDKNKISKETRIFFSRRGLSVRLAAREYRRRWLASERAIDEITLEFAKAVGGALPSVHERTLQTVGNLVKKAYDAKFRSIFRQYEEDSNKELKSEFREVLKMMGVLDLKVVKK